MENFNVRTILVLDYKKIKPSIQWLNLLLVTQALIKHLNYDKIKKIGLEKIGKDWIVLDVIIKHGIKIFEYEYKENK